jgi:predicted Zn-dependent protease
VVAVLEVMKRLIRRLFGLGRNVPLDELKRVLKEQEGDTAILFLTDCLVAFAKADYDQAHRQIDAGLAENPDHPKLMLWRGMVLFKEYRYKEAVEAFRQTVKVDPNCDEAKNMLSCRELAIYSGVADRLQLI